MATAPRRGGGERVEGGVGGAEWVGCFCECELGGGDVVVSVVSGEYSAGVEGEYAVYVCGGSFFFFSSSLSPFPLSLSRYDDNDKSARTDFSPGGGCDDRYVDSDHWTSLRTLFLHNK